MAASPLGVPVDLVVMTAPARPGWGTTLGRFIHRKPLGAAGGAIMLVMLVTAVLGWALVGDAGYCPGPALASLVGGAPEAVAFVGAMIAGIALVRLVRASDPAAG